MHHGQICVGHTARAPKGRKGGSQAAPKDRKLLLKCFNNSASAETICSWLKYSIPPAVPRWHCHLLSFPLQNVDWRVVTDRSVPSANKGRFKNQAAEQRLQILTELPPTNSSHESSRRERSGCSRSDHHLELKWDKDIGQETKHLYCQIWIIFAAAFGCWTPCLNKVGEVIFPLIKNCLGEPSKKIGLSWELGNFI